MTHLIELRARLIKCAGRVRRGRVLWLLSSPSRSTILVWPYVWVAGPENTKFIYNGCWNTRHPAQAVAVRCGLLAFPVIATQIYNVCRARPSTATNAAPSCRT